MDGLSVAASALGVVSFAVQLIQLTQNLRDFFNDVSGAPNEIRRLTLSLTQLASILRDVQIVTEVQEAQEGAPSAPLSLLASLKACEEKLLLLKTIVDSSEQRLRASGRVSRRWESFKVVFKKKDIERFGEHLQQSIQFLTTAMTMNLMVLKYVASSLFVPMLTELVLLVSR
jgi:Fungal N-terminal domain of STAND proteins